MTRLRAWLKKKWTQRVCDHDWSFMDADGNPVGYDTAYGGVLQECRKCEKQRWT